MSNTDIELPSPLRRTGASRLVPGHFLFHGSARSSVVRIRAVVDGVQHDVRPAAVPGITDRVFFGFAAEVGRATPNQARYTIWMFDAEGNEVDGPANEQGFPLGD